MQEEEKNGTSKCCNQQLGLFKKSALFFNENLLSQIDKKKFQVFFLSGFLTIPFVWRLPGN